MRYLIGIVAVVFVSGVWAATVAAGPCDPCDVNCDSVHDLLDVPPFVNALLTGTAGCSACAGDLDGNGVVDGGDIQGFVDCLLNPPPVGVCCAGAGGCSITMQAACTGVWLGAGTICQAGSCAFGKLTAYRPQHGAGYFPFTKTAVADADEESATNGAGIRINSPGDADLQGEDDLIEVLVERTQTGVPLALARSNGSLRVWTTRTKTPGSEIAFVANKTAAIAFGAGNTLTVWIEWAVAPHGTADLRLEPVSAAVTADLLRFHTFQSIVIALGGEGQAPSVPVDTGHGAYVTGIDLYNRGYDVFLHDEGDVAPGGAGSAYDDVVDSVSHRMVSKVAIFGYSHGGGSTYFLSDRLDVNRAGIGSFNIAVTGYIDGVRNNSNFDTAMETRRPPASGYHANQYQVGTLSDIFLDGGPVTNSDPPPTGLNVETQPWGVGATHFIVDDYAQVQGFVETNLMNRMVP